MKSFDEDYENFEQVNDLSQVGQATTEKDRVSVSLPGCLFYGILAFFVLWFAIFCGGIIWFFVCLFFSVKVGTEVYQAPKTQEFLHGEKPPAVKILESDETP